MMYYMQTQKSVSRCRFSSLSVTRANGTSPPHIINFFVNSKTKKIGWGGAALFVCSLLFTHFSVGGSGAKI